MVLKISIMRSRYLFVLILVISLGHCKVAEPLTLQKRDYRLNNLKTQGYFIKCDNEYCYPFYLFKNGVYLSCGAVRSKDKRLIDSTITDFKFIESLKNIQYGWGVFKVSANNISIEEWLPGNGGPYPTQLYNGTILNDSTIFIAGLRGTKYQDKLDTFRFRYLEMKPDSTNAFIR